jgi:hypothetical protein
MTITDTPFLELLGYLCEQTKLTIKIYKNEVMLAPLKTAGISN